MRKGVTFLGLALALTGCTYRSSILSASVTKIVSEDATISVRISQQDARAIERWEFSFSIEVISCHGPQDGYPMEPYHNGESLHHFQTGLPKGEITLTGTIPARLLKEYAAPCVFLRGGSYLGRRILSGPVPLTFVAGIQKP